MASQQITSSGIGLFGGSSSNCWSNRVSSIGASQIRLLSTTKKKTSFQRPVAPKHTSVKPWDRKVFSKIKSKDEKAPGGILPYSTAQTKPQGGEVTTLGESKVDISDKAGFQVVYLKHAGTKVEFNGSKHLILKEDDIVGIIENEDIKNLKLLNKRVLIKVTDAESKTAGGLLLTEATKEKEFLGRSVTDAESKTAGGLLLTEATMKSLSLRPDTPTFVENITFATQVAGLLVILVVIPGYLVMGIMKDIEVFFRKYEKDEMIAERKKENVMGRVLMDRSPQSTLSLYFSSLLLFILL
ncbi:hypothetical protein GIB67_030687 [Kingdonia uniflora]|uniref:Uncharacterized protein n=1 Tax=Kingdonia uniflora TaxID=39325 RepID=A0A7J7NJ39_9MAGN|nr:hypothetical protein GIB67_030687 [Kingdonia uniflora]